MAGTRGQPPEARVRRVAGALARKGYPPGLVFRAHEAARLRPAIAAARLRRRGSRGQCARYHTGTGTSHVEHR